MDAVEEGATQSWLDDDNVLDGLLMGMCDGDVFLVKGWLYVTYQKTLVPLGLPRRVFRGDHCVA